MIRVRVPASTSNLGSGFDTFGLALQLYLTVEMETISSGLEIEVVGEGASEIPTDKSNLLYKALQRFFSEVGHSHPNLKITIENEIPITRGLGSSSAATIAGLLCASELCGKSLPPEELILLANELEGHPENAASSLLGGLTINCIDDKRVITKKLAAPDNLKVVLLIPETRISTSEARDLLPKKVAFQDAVFNVQRGALLANCFATNDFTHLKVAMQDRLHQKYRKKFIPGFGTFEKSAYENGALGVGISGSGPSVIAFIQDDNNHVADNWIKEVNRVGVKAKIVTKSLDNEGAKILRT